MPRDFDCIVVGAGLAGAALAVGLARFGLRVAAVDAREPAAASPGRDERGLALALSSQRLLRALDLWPLLEPRLTPLRHIEVSAMGHFGSSSLSAAELGLEALGHICPADHLLHTLDAALANTPNLVAFFGQRVAQIETTAARVEITLQGAVAPAVLSARLLIAADGSRSAVRQHFGIEAQLRDYQQTAIVANIDLEHPAPHTACERFTAEGPTALLPLGGKRHVLVRTVRTAGADALLAASPADYLNDVQQRLGWRWGRCANLGERRAHPLMLNRAKALTAPRTVLVGNAANTIHPNAAQGLNLALRDVVALIDALKDCAAEGRDPGQAATLEAYARARADDHSRTAGFSDSLARGFALDWPLVGMVRSGALLAFDAVPPLRHALMRRLMGATASVPEWLRAGSARA